MKQTIWKYELEITDTQAVIMPDASKIIHVDNQNGNLCLWAIVCPDAPLVQRAIGIAGTGNPLEFAPNAYVGSAIVGSFVWHVFEIFS